MPAVAARTRTDADEARRLRWGLWLSDRMRALGLTDVALAAALGVTHTTVQRWRAGSSPAGALAYKLAEVLDVGHATMARAMAGMLP